MKKISNQKFTVEQTNIAKGLACLLLIFHHLFYDSEKYRALFTPLFYAGDIPLACYISSLCKVCVAMFLILSGYGISVKLSKLYENNERAFTRSLKVMLGQLIKLLSSFVVIFVLFVPWQGFVGHMTYDSWVQPLADILGLADAFGTPTMNPTWWYMSIVIICYLITPVAAVFVRKFPALVFSGTAFVYLFSSMHQDSKLFRYLLWICIYVAGMLIQRWDILNKCIVHFSGKMIYGVFACLIGAVTMCYLRLNFGILADLFFAVALVLLSCVVISRIPGVNSFFGFVGKHSGNIFMFHTFIYSINFTSFVYMPKYAPFIYVLFLALCLGISVLIEMIKKVTRYNILVDKLTLKLK